ncbi:MAG: hypothetical protein EZS28_047267, partial [Streblomastix strix]
MSSAVPLVAKEILPKYSGVKVQGKKIIKDKTLGSETVVWDPVITSGIACFEGKFDPINDAIIGIANEMCSYIESVSISQRDIDHIQRLLNIINEERS